MQHVQQSERPAPVLHIDKHQINSCALGWALLPWISLSVNCLRLRVSYGNKSNDKSCSKYSAARQEGGDCKLKHS